MGLVGDAGKIVEVYVAERTRPSEANPPGRNKLHSFIHWAAARAPIYWPPQPGRPTLREDDPNFR